MGFKLHHGVSRKAQFALGLATFAAVSMWIYVDLILIPHQRSEAAATGRPRGNLSDLYPRWLGARELILNGRDPYNPEVTREIQEGYYGRQLDSKRPNDPKDQQGFAYPAYVVFLLAPTVRLPFPIVQVGFRWLLLLLTALTIPLWMRALGLVRGSTALVWIVFTLGSYPAVQGLKLQQLTLLVCALLAGCAAALSSGLLAFAGVLLAVATIKPQLAAIPAAWLAIWTLSGWRERKRLAWAFSGTMALLLGGAQLLLPGWLGKFRHATSAYLQYTGGGKSVLDVGLGAETGKFLTALMLAALGIFLWLRRRDSQSSPGFAQTFAVVLAFSLVVIPTYAPYNQLLLLPALMLIVNWLPGLWRKDMLQRMLVVITAVAVLWPWVAAILLDGALLLYPAHRVQGSWSLPLYTSLAIPVTVLALLTLALSAPAGGAEVEPKTALRDTGDHPDKTNLHSTLQ